MSANVVCVLRRKANAAKPWQARDALEPNLVSEGTIPMAFDARTAPCALPINSHPFSINELRPAGSPAASTATTSISQITALAAGSALALASITTNVLYAIGRAPDLPQAILWSTVAACASIGLALSPAALVSAVKLRRSVPAIAAVAGFVVFGAYALSGALGNAAGLRMTRTADAADMTSLRARAQRAYDDAAGKLKIMPATRTVPEISAEITRFEASRRDLDPTGKGVCVGWLPSIDARRTCVQISEARAELGRSEERDRLTASLQAATATLDRLAGSKAIGNSDSAALSAVLKRLGIVVEPVAVDEWLAILAVVLLELGGGIVLAFADVLGRPAPKVTSRGVDTTPTAPQTVPVAEAKTPTTRPATTAAAATTKLTDNIIVLPTTKRPGSDNPATTSSLAVWIQALPIGKGTKIAQRALARQLGVTQQAVQKGLKRLSDAGVVEVVGGAHGTVVTRLSA